MTSGVRPFLDTFVADEPDHCQRLWHQLLSLSDGRDVDLYDLVVMLRSNDLPVAVGLQIAVIIDQLSALGSLRRLFDVMVLRDQIDAIGAEPQIQSLILFGLRDEDL